MSHEVNDEHLEVLASFTHEMIAMRNRFAEYVAKFELYGFLTKSEAEFWNDIAIACQKFSDNEQLTNRSKDNGKLGSK